MIFLEDLQKNIKNAFHELYQVELSLDEIKIQPTKKEFEGSHTFVVFPYLKIARKKPEVLAEEMGQHILNTSGLVDKFNVVKGFLNLVLKQHLWLQELKRIDQDQDFGRKEANGQNVMVEYSSPNTNKPLHLGHLRNNFLGYAISNILEANGYTVIKSNLVNDRGIHICKSMLAYQKFGHQETPESSGTKGDHLVGKYYVEFDKAYKKEITELVNSGLDQEKAAAEAPILLEAQKMLKAWEEGDPQVVKLWETMNGWVYQGFDETYKKIGVDFDHIYYESNTYKIGKDVVDEGLEKEVFYRKEDGSVWADLSSDGLDEKLLLRSDGTSVYITQDLGTADLKYKEHGLEKSIYVVGNEQDYHFQVLQVLLKNLGRSYADNIFHLSYGMVDLPSGKMKSREGTVVDADDLVQQMIDTAARHTSELGKIEGFNDEQARDLYEKLGLGALKYFLLKVDPRKRMLFNPEESIQFHGFTGPFIQYTYARIRSIIRKSEDIGIRTTDFDASQPLELTTLEQEIIMLIGAFPDKLMEAAKDFNPSVVATYAYDLAKEYNRFYAENPILGEVERARTIFRVVLSAQVSRIIAKSMHLLGIDVPERM